MLQLALPLVTDIELEFDFSFKAFDGRSCYTRREHGETFLKIGEYNFFGNECFILFRFLTEKGIYQHNADVIIPELNDLSKQEIIEFANSVVLRHLLGEFKWDTVDRCRIYK